MCRESDCNPNTSILLNSPPVSIYNTIPRNNSIHSSTHYPFYYYKQPIFLFSPTTVLVRVWSSTNSGIPWKSWYKTVHPSSSCFLPAQAITWGNTTLSMHKQKDTISEMKDTLLLLNYYHHPDVYIISPHTKQTNDRLLICIISVSDDAIHLWTSVSYPTKLGILSLPTIVVCCVVVML